jgi:hypothetical protein
MSGESSEQRIEETETVPDPLVYWPMTIYCLRLDKVMIELRHLYEPQEALRWLTSGQAHLGNRVPADLLLTASGKCSRCSRGSMMGLSHDC